MNEPIKVIATMRHLTFEQDAFFQEMVAYAKLYRDHWLEDRLEEFLKARSEIQSDEIPVLRSPILWKGVQKVRGRWPDEDGPAQAIATGEHQPRVEDLN